MRISRAFLLLFIGLFSCDLFAQHSEILNLQQAIEIALTNNRSVQNARLEVEKSSEQVSAVKARLFPSPSLNVLTSRLISPFSLSFDRGAFGDFPDIGPVPAEDTKVKTEPACS